MSELKIDQLQPNKANRDFPTEGGEWKEFCGSVRKHGILQPLLVRPIGEPGDPDRYEIVMGERRWTAAGKAGLDRVPCVVESYTDKEVLVLMLVENLNRRDLNPIEEGEAVAEMVDVGLSPQEAAEGLCKELEWVQLRLGLLLLPEDAKAAIAAGTFEVPAAEMVLELPEAKREEAVQLILHPTFQSLPLRPEQAEEMIRYKILLPLEQKRKWEAHRDHYRGEAMALIRSIGVESPLVVAPPYDDLGEYTGSEWVAWNFSDFEAAGDEIPRIVAADLAERHGAAVVVVPKAGDVESWVAVTNWRLLRVGEEAVARALDRRAEELAKAQSITIEEAQEVVWREAPSEARPWIQEAIPPRLQRGDNSEGCEPAGEVASAVVKGWVLVPEGADWPALGPLELLKTAMETISLQVHDPGGEEAMQECACTVRLSVKL